MKKLIVIILVVILAIFLFKDVAKNYIPQDYINKAESAISYIKDEAKSAVRKTAKFLKVIDGDTILVEDENGNEERIRLIGIDTPESVNSDEEKNCPEGKEASDYTKSLLSDVETVYLTYDKEEQDKYGRELCYVWLNDDTSDINNMLNYQLVKNGIAKPMCIMPNCSYATEFDDAESFAKENKNGFWKSGSLFYNEKNLSR